MSGTPLSLSLNPSSSSRADTGDNLTEVGGFRVDFGDKNGADWGDDMTSPITSIGTQIIQAVIVAVIARYAMKALFK